MIMKELDSVEITHNMRYGREIAFSIPKSKRTVTKFDWDNNLFGRERFKYRMIQPTTYDCFDYV